MTTVDTSEKLYSQFIGFRGEIQSSRARLYPLSVNLGEVGGCEPLVFLCFILFCLVLFYFDMLYNVLICFILFVLFCFVMLCHILSSYPSF